LRPGAAMNVCDNEGKVYCKNCCDFSRFLGCRTRGKPIEIHNPATGETIYHRPTTQELAGIRPTAAWDFSDCHKASWILNRYNNCPFYKPRPWPWFVSLFRRKHAALSVKITSRS